MKRSRMRHVTIYAITPTQYGVPLMTLPAGSANTQSVHRELFRLRMQCRKWIFFTMSQLSNYHAVGRQPTMREKLKS